MPQSDHYLTVATSAQAVYREKGSKFYGFVFEVETEEQVGAELQKLKKLHPSATHHCYAWLLRKDGKVLSRSNDDREPSGTAGKPILGKLTAEKLNNVLLVVVRYFGGTQLGAAGLMRAYRECARITLAETTRLEKFDTCALQIRCIPDKMNEVMSALKALHAKITRNEFENEYLLECDLRKNHAIQFRQKLRALPGITITEM